MITRTPYLIVDGPGSRITVGGFWTWDYDSARRHAVQLKAIVTNAAWYRRRFGVDPLLVLRELPTPADDRRAVMTADGSRRLRLPAALLDTYRAIVADAGRVATMARLCRDRGVNYSRFCSWRQRTLRTHRTATPTPPMISSSLVILLWTVLGGCAIARLERWHDEHGQASWQPGRALIVLGGPVVWLLSIIGVFDSIDGYYPEDRS